MKITQVQDISSQKGYKFNNQFFVAYKGNINFDEQNADYLAIKEFIAQGGKVEPEYTETEFLIRAKENKLTQLKANFDNASKKPHTLNQVKQIDKTGNVIGTVNAFYNIQDVNSLTDSANIIFAGSIMKIQAFLRLLCVGLKLDFDVIKNQVNALSENPATASIANIPYTTKDKNGNEIRVLLSFAKIEEIFSHIFDRVAKNASAFNIKEEEIKSAKTIEELDKINIEMQ